MIGIDHCMHRLHILLQLLLFLFLLLLQLLLALALAPIVFRKLLGL